MHIGLTEPWLKQMDESEYSFLNPAFEPNMIQHFDVGYGYQVHHLNCIRLAPKVSEDRLDDLNLRGFHTRPVLEPAYAAQLAARVKQADRTLYPADFETAEVEEVLRAVFSPQIHQTINRYFLTEFAVIFFALLLTKPLADQPEPGKPGVSFGWHCDGGPTKHLKMMVYLNPADEHDGATDFLDSFTTGLFKKIGYVFCPLQKRLPDLGALATRHGIAYDPVRLRPDAGEAIIFEPAGVLHKGVYPTRGVRCVIHLGLIPWAEPWHKFFQENYDLLVQNTGSGFPKLK